MGKGGLFDLENHFAFYGAYHSNPVNIFIHMLFVWPILFTALVLPYFIPLLDLSLFGIAPSAYTGSVVLNFGALVALIYALFYVCLDIKAGSVAAFLVFLCWTGANSVARQLGFALAWKVVLAAQLICWTAQFIGHGVFEKRPPALLDNLTQALLMAPFFVLLEALGMAFGYEPYPGFRDKVDAKIKEEIEDRRRQKAKKI